MDFAFSDEQEEFRATLRRFFEEKAPSAEVRRLMEASEGYDPGVWKQMAEELGLQGVHLPEACGGQGFGFLELGIVLEEMGRVLFPSPYFATVCLAANAVLNAGSESQKRALLPGIAAGETLATLALCEESGGFDAAGITLVATPDGGGYRLDGHKSFVIDGHIADCLVVAARRGGSEGTDGVTLVTVRSDDPGVVATPLETMDEIRKQARIEFSGARAELLGEEGGGWPPLSKTLDQANIMLAAEMLGGSQRCLEMAVDYAKVRMQFARPIGSFQAIKHKAAEMLLEVELAKSAGYWSWWVADQRGEQLAEAASLAKSVCTDTFLRAAGENIQIHGGIGFTWEHDAHLYLKRAKGSEILFGDATEHRSRLATQLGL
jgi:alkylation response protein AidB-like acyl-CoA dehydrogenase